LRHSVLIAAMELTLLNSPTRWRRPSRRCGNRSGIPTVWAIDGENSPSHQQNRAAQTGFRTRTQIALVRRYLPRCGRRISFGGFFFRAVRCAHQCRVPLSLVRWPSRATTIERLQQTARHRAPRLAITGRCSRGDSPHRRFWMATTECDGSLDSTADTTGKKDSRPSVSQAARSTRWMRSSPATVRRVCGRMSGLHSNGSIPRGAAAGSVPARYCGYWREYEREFGGRVE
jgi:hypothetical protein